MFIFTDTMLLVKSMTLWIAGWRRRNWLRANGAKVKNVDLLTQMIGEHGRRRVIWSHVKAHTNGTDWKSAWNQVADRMAVAASSREAEQKSV